MRDRINALAASAASAAATGRWQEAEQLWQQVRGLDPGHAQALYSLGVHAFQRGDYSAARELLEKACELAPRDPMMVLSLSAVWRELNDVDHEWRAIIAALDIDPYFLPALLTRGEFLERRGQPRAAARVFRNALKVVPQGATLPTSLNQRLEHARRVVERDLEEVTAFLRQSLGAGHESAALAADSRWDEAISILAGRTKPYASVCNQLHIPRLPAITFYDDGLFPWMRDMEAMVDSIKAELQAMIVRRENEFVPYIQYARGAPVNQWEKLNHSRNWSGFHLYANGEPVAEHLQQCPLTAEALSAVDLATIPGLCPNAMFSALAPGAHIPPHTGETNARLVAHLPLVVPADCHYRVGYDWRQWQEGKVWVFDDTVEHEARNDSAEQRVILMFDVWNPLLSTGEREIAAALAGAMNRYRSDVSA